MRLLSIGLVKKPSEGFEDRLRFEFDFLREEGYQTTIKKVSKGDTVYFYCCVDDETILKEKRFSEYKRAFIDCVANALSDIIINFWEPILIKRIIQENYFFFNIIERNRIYDFTLNILDYNELSKKSNISLQIKRKTFVSRKIREYLNNNSTIILDGFINFRLKEYIKQLEEMVDIATDEYLIDKEYREFIKLLRFFVALQESKRDLVNVVFQNDKIILMDQECKFIKADSNLDLITRNNPKINEDDVIVSTLINIAPRKIIIHGFTGKKREVVDALYNIFEGRISFCYDCEICFKSKPLTTK